MLMFMYMHICIYVSMSLSDKVVRHHSCVGIISYGKWHDEVLGVIIIKWGE